MTKLFRTRFAAGEPLMGSFVKTPAPHPVEVLGQAGFDFVVIDQEHAPWDRGTTELALLAARAVGTAGIVRVPDGTPSKILAVLDDGAAGVLVPHVYSVEIARAVASACRYRGGSRGFSNTTRAGDYGAIGIWDHVDKADAEVCFVAMIEDVPALDHLDEIMAVDGLHGVFIGRGDLAVAMGAASMEAPEVKDACTRICDAAKRAGKPVMMMAAGKAQADEFRALGASAFVVASDQGFMRQAALKTLADMAP